LSVDSARPVPTDPDQLAQQLADQQDPDALGHTELDSTRMLIGNRDGNPTRARFSAELQRLDTELPQ
jgi:hypothetical protein